MPKKLTPFHYWTQKALPEIYDDSLSYYELLNKVVGYLNEAMSNVNTLSDNVTEIYRAVVDLQQYVDERLDETVEEKIEEYFRTHEFVGNVSVDQILTQGVKIGSINVDGVITELFAPEGGVVSVDQIVTSGTEIAGVTVDGVRTPIFSKSISVTGELTAGTKIGSITVGGETVELFAPEGGGSTVSFTPELTTGVRIGTISIDGVETALFAPSGGGGSGAVDSVNGKIGDVVLNAEDVGARSDTWMPSAEDVGARSDTWMPTAEDVGALPNTVTTLPNPNKLTFTGAVSAEYDGSGAVSVNIPQGGGGDKTYEFEVVIPPSAWNMIEGTNSYYADFHVDDIPDDEQVRLLRFSAVGALTGDIPLSSATAQVFRNTGNFRVLLWPYCPAPTVNARYRGIYVKNAYTYVYHIPATGVKNFYSTSDVGKFLTVGSNGIVTTTQLSEWNGGSY